MKLAPLSLAVLAGVAVAGSAAAQPPPSNDVLRGEPPEAELPAAELHPPAVRPYRKGDPVPPGYHVESSYHTPLLAGGALALLGAYAAAALVARVEPDLASEGATPNYGPLYAPLIGPYIAAADDGWSGGGRAVFATLGALQTVGFGLMMVGLVQRELLLAPDDGGVQAPQIVAGPGGAMLIGHF